MGFGGRMYQVNAAPFGAHPQSGTIIAIAQDITARAQLEDALQLSNLQLSGIVDSMNAYVYITNLENQVTIGNRQFAAAVGIDVDAIIGKPIGTLMPSEFAAPLMANSQAVLKSGSAHTFDEVLPSENGPRTYMSIRAPLVDATGALCGVTCVSTDVTAQRQAEEELQTIERSKDEFIVTLAHELRQPLAAVGAAMEVIKRRRSASSVQRAHSVIDRQVSHLRRLTDDLMESVRIAKGKLSIRRGQVNLNEVASEAAAAVSASFESHHHRFRQTLPDEPVFIEGDADRLMQVVSNLLTNAAKYTEDGGDIGLQVVNGSTYVEVRVRDSGQGIARERLPHVFDLFVQASDVDRGGLGLGLAVVRGLVQRHGGTIEARSEGAGRGSEFVVRLPVCAIT